MPGGWVSAVTVLLIALPVAAVTLLEAPDRDPTLAPSGPAPGWSGTYHLATPRDGVLPPTGVPAFDFTWLAPTTALDAGGRARPVIPLELAYTDGSRSLLHVAPDGTVLSETRTVAGSASGGNAHALVTEMSLEKRQEVRATIFARPDAPILLPCPLAPLGAPTAATCAWTGGDAASLAGPWRDAGGRDGIRRADSGDLQVWTDPAIPVPLAAARADRPDQPSLRLVRAEYVADPRSLAPAAPAGPLVWAPWDGLVPAEDGLDHPFPLSQAIAAASRERGAAHVQTFLEAHPDAFLEEASFAETRAPTTISYSWRITFTDGTDRVSACPTLVHRETPVGVVPQAGPKSLVGGPVYSSACGEGPGPEAPPSARPDRAPTVASLVARWRSFAGLSDADAAPGWGFRVRDGPDGEPTVEWQAGTVVWTSRFDAGQQGLSRHYVESVDLLSLDAAGEAVRHDREHSTSRTTYAAPLKGRTEGQPMATQAETSDPSWPALWVTGVTSAGALALLALARLLPLVRGYTRVDPERALDHPVRAALAAAIGRSPGIHLEALRRDVQLGRSPALHHLRLLVRTGKVVERRSFGYLCYFPAGGLVRGAAQAVASLKSEGARRILEAMMAQPAASVSALARQTGLRRQTVQYHLSRLREAGLVADGNAVAPEQGRQALQLAQRSARAPHGSARADPAPVAVAAV